MANQITSPCPQGNTTATSATTDKLRELYLTLDNAFSYQSKALELAYELLGETNDSFYDEIILALESNDNTLLLNALYDDVENKIKGGSNA